MSKWIIWLGSDLIALSLCFNCYAVEVLTDLSTEQGVSVLNEELRKLTKDTQRLSDDVDDITVRTTLDSLTDVATITEEQGDIIYYDGSDWNALSHGTDGQYLKTQGDSANPVWSSITTNSTNYTSYVFSFGHDDTNSSGSYGYNDVTAGIVDNNIVQYAWTSTGNTYNLVLETKFKKEASTDTITFWCCMESSGGGDDDSYCQLDIGGETGIATSPSQAKTWTSGTVDVSGLTNGTTYDVDIKLRHEYAHTVGLYAIIAFGS